MRLDHLLSKEEKERCEHRSYEELAHKFLNLYCSILKELALRAGDSISE